MWDHASPITIHLPKSATLVPSRDRASGKARVPGVPAYFTDMGSLGMGEV